MDLKKWMENGWKMDGKWMENGWKMDGKWICLAAIRTGIGGKPPASPRPPGGFRAWNSGTDSIDQFQSNQL